MAYYENITAGRGAIDSFANALNSQRFANLMLNETISNFSNNITRAGALYDESKIREDALKYQRMQDFYNNKRKDEAFELEKKQAEQSMDFAKRQQVMNEEMRRQNKRLNDLEMQRLAQDIRMNERQFRWLMKATPSAKASVSVDNNAMKTPTTPTTNALNMQGTPKPKTITKEEFKALFANPMSFRF
ncbi:hypothetical protein EC545_07740 [Helicobacter pylori]|uniref:hypothetical protein n=1 Tax=Helicobacter pylori TaxID=210 RepID=UPI000FDE749A|nr:hypothetical protein [Helicobacter pylori]RVZ36362.1 hypothetical protein EC545_07740 [Helicobacter pylori]RVZ75326.1 hypothetical protein EC593_07560 [Helicobacter pylori]